MESINHFLYGVAVQGIQPFVFQTNKLLDITGASELVEQICTTEFASCLGKNIGDLQNDSNVIQAAAGNIKYVFTDKGLCEMVVKTFPKQIMKFAPGITVSQAVVKLDKNNTMQEAIDKLEVRLRVQRNKPFNSLSVGSMAMLRSRNTGLPAVKIDNGRYLDAGTLAKLEAAKTSKRLIDILIKDVAADGIAIKDDPSIDIVPKEMKDITSSKSKDYSWLAVVHADGNNMGLIVQKLGQHFANLSKGEYIKKFRSFSLAIDAATKSAAKKAYAAVWGNNKVKTKIPFRPIVIGGDDLTIICRGDLALDFTKSFLINFQLETKNKLEGLECDFLNNGITACSGIAYIKESYPFYYGYNLAEQLCSYAKKISRNINSIAVPSSIMFHKVRGSYVDDYNLIIERELTVGGQTPVSLCFGPYFINPQGGTNYVTVGDIQKSVSQFEGKEGNAVKSDLRQWLTELNVSQGQANQVWERLNSLSGSKLRAICNNYSNLINSKGVINNKTPIYDWLTIHSIK